ncbi:uncharacterized protein LOC118411616 [Branchiostoma floridae]|uniref:Uncharacterized protein LOC118411616 n=1 Tax=Branchiostoma floridae TaxID=7739 RepID=A0A9J7MJW3_BRAFL|nr:uncharacterized protein LOC118411616 [Branchiostoma floridae]
MKVAKQVAVFLIILMRCESLDIPCFPGCDYDYTDSWSSCLPDCKSYTNMHPDMGRQNTACIRCTTAQLQLQHVANEKNLSVLAVPTPICLPNNLHVAVRGLSLGKLSVEKLRPLQQSKIQFLTLAECGITDLGEHVLGVFPRLSSLEIIFNGLTEVKEQWFSGLKHPDFFYSLSLSHNNISSIDSSPFQKLSFLTGLLLDNNSLKSIQSSWLAGLERLFYLSLKSNQIRNIHPTAFMFLRDLDKLDLSDNLLTYLSSDTTRGLHKLHDLIVGGRLPLIDASAPLVKNWKLDYNRLRTGEFIAVTVNEVLFCMRKRPRMTRYQVHVHHYNTLTQVYMDIVLQCKILNLELTSADKASYDLPIAIISNVNNTEHATSINQLCRDSWKDVGIVNVALSQDLNLRIVSIRVEKSYQTHPVAVILSAITTGNENINMSDAVCFGKNGTVLGHEELKNVTCLFNTCGKVYRHVFTTPLCNSPDDTVRVGEKGVTNTTKQPAKATVSTPSTAPFVTVGSDKEQSWGYLGLVTVLAVIGVTAVVLFLTYFVRRWGCCSGGNQAAQAGNACPGSPLGVVSCSSWMVSGASGPTVTVSAGKYSADPDEDVETTPKLASSSSDEQQYEEIPDEYFLYYNTRPASLHHDYWEIKDEHYNYENTQSRPLSLPLSLQAHLSGQDDEDSSITFYASAVNENYQESAGHRENSAPPYEVVKERARNLALMGKYGRLQRGFKQKASRVYLDARARKILTSNPSAINQNYQDPGRQRQKGAPSYETPTIHKSRARDLALVGKYGRMQKGFRQKANRVYLDAHKHESTQSKTQQNMSSTSQAPTIPTITPSKADVSTIREIVRKGKVKRSQTF